MNGIIFITFSYEIMTAPGINYNLFQDTATAIVIFYMFLGYFVVEQLCLFFAINLKLWKIKHENTAWHLNIQEEDDIDLPGWEDVKGASHESYVMNQRISSETFRYKFLNYNRSWLINQLPQLLTPRTLRRSRPYLINQLARIIHSKRDDISDDSEAEKEKFGPVALTSSSRTIIRWWLGKARRRIKLKSIVDPLIRKARGAECEQCLSRKQLQVDYEIDVDHMSAMYDREYPGEEEVDQVQWKSFWIKNQIYHTVCLSCVAMRKQKDIKEALKGTMDAVLYDDSQEAYPDWGPVYLTAASKAMILNWYRKAQRLRAGKKGGKRREKVIKNISDDEGDDIPADWAKAMLNVSAATKAIAIRWVRTARAKMLKRAGKGSGLQEKDLPDIPPAENFASGKKSALMRK